MCCCYQARFGLLWLGVLGIMEYGPIATLRLHCVLDQKRPVLLWFDRVILVMGP